AMASAMRRVSGVRGILRPAPGRFGAAYISSANERMKQPQMMTPSTTENFTGAGSHVAACRVAVSRKYRPSGHAAVDENGLPVHPPARSRQECHGLGDVRGLTEPVHRVRPGELRDLLLALAIQEQRGGGGSGRDRVHGDVPAAQLAGQ